MLLVTWSLIGVLGTPFGWYTSVILRGEGSSALLRLPRRNKPRLEELPELEEPLLMAGVAAQCCIVGGGPAGVMAGFLLARAGVEVVVLEKHADFLRDFRGDTIHPSTLELMHELGLIDAFLKLPHDKVEQLAGQVGDQVIPIADFRHLPTRSKFLVLMPQWEFLNFLTSQGERYPGFRLLMQTQATGLIEGSGKSLWPERPSEICSRPGGSRC